MFLGEKMKKSILTGVLLASFLCVVSPCINAIQVHEVKQEIYLRVDHDFESLESIYGQIKRSNANNQGLYMFLKTIYIVVFLILLPIIIFFQYVIPLYTPTEAFIQGFLISLFWPLVAVLNAVLIFNNNYEGPYEILEFYLVSFFVFTLSSMFCGFFAKKGWMNGDFIYGIIWAMQGIGFILIMLLMIWYFIEWLFDLNKQKITSSIATRLINRNIDAF